jgi:acyl-CoA synthetase (NDP forming)
MERAKGAMNPETRFLNLDEAFVRAAEMGLPVAEHRPASTADEAVKAAASIGYPVVLKVLSPLAVHKSEMGGVKLSLGDDEEVRRAFREISLSSGEHLGPGDFLGVTVSPMLSPGLEAIVGLTRDEELGSAVMFGLGGVSVELYKDVSFRLPPLSLQEAHRMIEEIRGYPLLTGYRGRTACDLEALVDCLIIISQIPGEEPDVAELELNPLILYPNGCRAADVRIAVID